MTPHLAWYLARASGLVAWGLLAASSVWGLWISTRLTSKRPPRGWLLDLHRFLGGLAVSFTAVHVAALVADSTVRFGAAEVLVPFASGWRPVAVAWGVVALYLLVAVEVTSLLMKRLPYRLWRAIHTASLGLYAASTAHLLAAGTDRGSPLLQWLVLASAAAVTFLLVARLLLPGRKRGAKGAVKAGAKAGTKARPAASRVPGPAASRVPGPAEPPTPEPAEPPSPDPAEPRAASPATSAG